jgi:hypothetical protein
VTAPPGRLLPPRAARPAPAEISALIAWARRLSDTGVTRADPAELAAFHQAKQDLLERIQRHNHARATTGNHSRETPVD